MLSVFCAENKVTTYETMLYFVMRMTIGVCYVSLHLHSLVWFLRYIPNAYQEAYYTLRLWKDLRLSCHHLQRIEKCILKCLVSESLYSYKLIWLLMGGNRLESVISTQFGSKMWNKLFHFYTSVCRWITCCIKNVLNPSFLIWKSDFVLMPFSFETAAILQTADI